MIFRYLAKEVFITLSALTTILLLIFMSNQFVRYLSRAASGNIPGIFIMKLMMLELPNLMGLLVPLGFYMALLIAYGRLYAESEMTVLQACGYGPHQLLKHSFIMASIVSFFVLCLMLWVSPLIVTERTTLLKTSGVQTLIQTIIPEHFRAVPGGHGQLVFYVEGMNREHTVAKNVFFARIDPSADKLKWDVVWADQAFVKTDPKTFEDYVILKDGHAYQGIPGKAAYQVIDFKELQSRLPHPTFAVSQDMGGASMARLWQDRAHPESAAEIQWRLSAPLMVLALTLVAVPLSRVNPRVGKYAAILPALVLYIIYANFVFISRNWIKTGQVPPWIGMWWLHLMVVIVGLCLMRRNQLKLS